MRVLFQRVILTVTNRRKGVSECVSGIRLL